MTAAMVLPLLILARIRRLQLWNRDKLDELLTEAKALHLRMSNVAERQSQTVKSFTEFLKVEKTGNVIRTLDSGAKGKVLSLKDKIGGKIVAEILAEKHPEGQPINPSCLVSHEKANPLPFHNSIFDKIDNNAIERAAQKTKGSGHLSMEKTSELIRQSLNQHP